jgi:hypothetical protein
MSAHNGDKSRYHRLRKRTIQRRLATEQLKKDLAAAAAAKAAEK